MKPISLKLAGLQSYRSMQEIDFTVLCDTGLFGIFGPTGSGKSTILDAITLALYGKVGRAHGGTQGIMNHSEDSLFVAFTFELMSAKGKELYRVERRFKRQGDISVSNTISRFVEIRPEGEKVIADKLVEVTRCVEEKIGLKMDDFTRAVVLPQGKFAEFLSLKGAERRAMLQRLFHLEKYGDQLAQKLSRKVRENDQALKELIAEQTGLGDASEEALREAKTAVAAATELAEARRRELKEAERLFEQLAKVRELSLERSARAAQLAKLREQDVAVAAQEAALEAASVAARIRPVLTAWKEARSAVAERATAAERARLAAEAATERARLAVAAAEQATAELGREEPALLLRLEQLEEAKALQAECEALLVELREIAAKRERVEVLLQQHKDELHKQEQLLLKARQRKQELEEQLGQVEVKAAERKSAQEAAIKQQAIEMARQALHSAEAEHREQAERTEAALARLENLKQEAVQYAEEQSALARLSGQAHAALSGLQSSAVALASELEQREQLLRRLMREQEEQYWSMRLAQTLKDGEACPVCGSTEHPALAQASFAHTSIDESELEELGRLLKETRDFSYVVSRDDEASLAIMRSMNDSVLALSGNSLVTSGDTSTVSNVHFPTEHDSLFDTVNKLEEVPFLAAATKDTDLPESLDTAYYRHQLSALYKEYTQWHQQIERCQEQLRAQQGRLSEYQAKLATAEAEAASSSSQLQKTTEKRRLCREELDRLMKLWHEAYPDASWEEAAVSMKKLHERDQAADELKQRLAKSTPFIEETIARIEQLKLEIAELDKQLVQWKTQEEGKHTLLSDKKLRLDGWTGGHSADGLLAEAKRKLEALRSQAATAKLRQGETDLKRQEAVKADVLAQQALQASVEQEQVLLARWEQELAASPFADESQVVAAYMDDEQVSVLTQQVKAHRDAEQELIINLRELDTKLDGRTVNEDEWQACSERLQLAKEQDEQALELKARSLRDLEELEKRHLRWKELEQLRLEKEHEAGLLAKLQSSLRGNAFVEYVAEEQLMNVSQAASQRLRFLTNQRYALECDSGGGFVICDDANGGVKRPVATLSGGETFLTSLALALALSAQIQLRGQYPLQFFFLDEGFGTLDPELLDTVITSLEHLHHDHLSVGIISHVAELRSRLARKLIIIPADSGGEGSRVMLEGF